LHFLSVNGSTFTMSAVWLTSSCARAAHWSTARVHGSGTALFRHSRSSHLGLRFGPDDEFVEAHFGPSDAGSFHEGFLKIGEGKVAQSEYLDEFPAGAMDRFSTP